MANRRMGGGSFDGGYGRRQGKFETVFFCRCSYVHLGVLSDSNEY